MDAATASISGVKPKTLLEIGEKHEVPGSGKRPWMVKRCEGDFYTCSCGAFQTAAGPSRKRSCVHLKMVLGEEYEAARRAWEVKKPVETTTTTTKSASATSSGAKRKAGGGGGAVASTSASAAAASTSTAPAAAQYGDTLTSGPILDDYEDLVASQGEAAAVTKKRKEDGLEYDAWNGGLMFNGRAKTKGYDKDTAIAIMQSEMYHDDKTDPTGWWMSEKLDGVRAYWTGTKLISRSNIDWKPPRWFIEKLPKGFALDGELWRERDGFEELSGVCRRADQSAWGTINYFVFDAPDVPLPFEERIQAARRRVPDDSMTPDEALAGKFGGRITVLPQQKCKGKAHLQAYLEEVQKVCGEGVMLRRPNSPYERKRSRHSLKVKTMYDAEALVVGYTAGKGRHWGEMGSLGLLMECGTIFTCGSGLTNEMRREWLPPYGTLVRYRFSELTADHVPRFPVYMGICCDRTAPKDADCRTTAFRTARKQREKEQQEERDRQRIKDAGGDDEEPERDRESLSPVDDFKGERLHEARKVSMADLVQSKPR